MFWILAIVLVILGILCGVMFKHFQGRAETLDNEETIVEWSKMYGWAAFFQGMSAGFLISSVISVFIALIV